MGACCGFLFWLERILSSKQPRDYGTGIVQILCGRLVKREMADEIHSWPSCPMPPFTAFVTKFLIINSLLFFP